jgi:acyl-coenzyme A synthetase/AMP-(fatty) acid ligase
MASIYQSLLIPFSGYERLSISQFMVQYNPDDVSSDKVVHTDAFSKTPITYGGLRRDAGRAAWGLREKLGVRPGDTILAILPNSVWGPWMIFL